MFNFKVIATTAHVFNFLVGNYTLSICISMYISINISMHIHSK